MDNYKKLNELKEEHKDLRNDIYHIRELSKNYRLIKSKINSLRDRINKISLESDELLYSVIEEKGNKLKNIMAEQNVSVLSVHYPLYRDETETDELIKSFVKEIMKYSVNKICDDYGSECSVKEYTCILSSGLGQDEYIVQLK